jgi:hypothetical protein
MTQRHATVLKRLPPNQTLALELLASGARTSDVAATLGVHRATVWKWQQEPAFEQAILSIQEDARAILRDGLRNQAARAVLVLGELMGNPDPRTRRDAAKAVLGSYGRLRSSEAPAPTPEPDMTQEEYDERVLALWRHVQHEEERMPGFLASNSRFARVKALALEIQARRSGAGVSP